MICAVRAGSAVADEGHAHEIHLNSVGGGQAPSFPLVAALLQRCDDRVAADSCSPCAAPVGFGQEASY